MPTGGSGPAAQDGGTTTGTGGADFATPPAADDADNDGYKIADGDCNDYDNLVGPGAVEVAGNNVDDDCDGQTDETESACDATLSGGSADALAKAMGLCDTRFLKQATLSAADPSAAAVLADYGTNFGAQEGARIAVLSTGVAARKGGAGYVSPQSGTDFGGVVANPDPSVPVVPGCGQASQPSEVYDATVLEVKLKVPQNAKSFSFTFNYYSAEYPEWVCNEFNDTFLVEMKSSQFTTPKNIAYDAMNQAITINNGFFAVCDNWNTARTMGCTQPGANLDGSGYEDADAAPGQVCLPFVGCSGGGPANRKGGATGWLTTTAPVIPGEEVTLQFIVFDSGDGILDSASVIDNFVWSLNPATEPTTIP